MTDTVWHKALRKLTGSEAPNADGKTTTGPQPGRKEPVMLKKPLPALLDPKAVSSYLIELNDADAVKRALVNYLVHAVGKDPAYGTPRDWFYAMAFMVRGALSERYINTTRQR